MASKRRVRRRTCGDKQAFSQQGEAVAFLISYKRRTAEYNIRTYKCPFCHQWHIGHYANPARAKYFQ